MTDTEFFQQTQEQWFEEWVDCEVREIVLDTNPHAEIFEFEDIPF